MLKISFYEKYGPHGWGVRLVSSHEEYEGLPAKKYFEKLAKKLTNPNDPFVNAFDEKWCLSDQGNVLENFRGNEIIALEEKVGSLIVSP